MFHSLPRPLQSIPKSTKSIDHGQRDYELTSFETCKEGFEENSIEEIPALSDLYPNKSTPKLIDQELMEDLQHGSIRGPCGPYNLSTRTWFADLATKHPWMKHDHLSGIIPSDMSQILRDNDPAWVLAPRRMEQLAASTRNESEYQRPSYQGAARRSQRLKQHLRGTDGWNWVPLQARVRGAILHHLIHLIKLTDID